MDRKLAVSRLNRLHRAQDAFHAGKADAELRRLLTDDVLWVIPGDNSIAGTYEGIDSVMTYFRRRRELADRSFRLHAREILVGDGELLAALTDGTALLGGVEHRWSTIGLYRFRDELVSSCRLVPFDQAEFDRIWCQR